MAYRVGIIGCGGVGHIHVRSWQQRKDVDVVAAMDVSEEAHGKRAIHMEIMMAIFESVRVRNVVKMPLDTCESPMEAMVADGTMVDHGTRAL